MIQLICLAMLSGVLFGAMSWPYQMGRRWGVPASHVASVLLVIGFVFFLGYWFRYDRSVLAPLSVWTLPLLGGLGQVLGVVLLDPAQKRGPAAPVFCALNLTFLPAAIFAVGLLGERLTAWQSLGLVAALGCVVIAGWSQPAAGDSPGTAPEVRHGGWLYPLLLLGLMLGTSLATMVMKYLQATPAESGSLLDLHKGTYLMMTYGGSAAGMLVLLCFKDRVRVQWRRTLGLGGVAAVGSIGGFITLCSAATLPGGVGFAVTNVMCFLTIALIAAFVFKERRTLAWYGTVVLAILSVLLFASSAGS
jgi:drug/metabolite transporter (DMT)-like permease